MSTLEYSISIQSYLNEGKEKEEKKKKEKEKKSV